MADDASGRASFGQSAALLARMQRTEALLAARPAMYFSGYEPLGGYPVFARRAKGAHVWDIDGNRYVDFLLGFGSVVLGHADPEVNAAVFEALENGVNPTLISPLQVDLAERIVRLVPAAEQVTFLRTGSDAIDAAVRLARAVTGRRHLLCCGHHGWHDWSSRSPGVLPEVAAATHALAFGNLAAAAGAANARAGDIAAIVAMPYDDEVPDPEWLRGLQSLARAHDALFILDEVRSGFRIALGGAQGLFGLEPDLTALSKAMANGHAISALAGRRAIMRHILKLGLTVTFYRSPEAIAAALATLTILERDAVPDTLARRGARLLDDLAAAVRLSGVPARPAGHPATPFLKFAFEDADRDARAMRIFCTTMLRQGILLTPAHHWFLCAATSDADIAQFGAAAKIALGRVAEAMAAR